MLLSGKKGTKAFTEAIPFYNIVYISTTFFFSESLVDFLWPRAICSENKKSLKFEHLMCSILAIHISSPGMFE